MALSAPVLLAVSVFLLPDFLLDVVQIVFIEVVALERNDRFQLRVEPDVVLLSGSLELIPSTGQFALGSRVWIQSQPPLHASNCTQFCVIVNEKQAKILPTLFDRIFAWYG